MSTTDQLENSAASDKPVAPEAVCYSCRGETVRMKRVKVEGKWKREEQSCNACGGKGYIARSKRKGASGMYAKKVNRKSYPSFVAPGPMPVGDQGKPALQEAADEELCYLVGNWRLFQRIDRHRYSTDDLVTTWIAAAEARRLGHTGESSPALVLDIGCGIGSVLLSNAWQLPHATCVGIEAQEERYAQAVRSIAYNVGDRPTGQTRVSVYNSDMRDAGPLLKDDYPNGFDVITGTPPYFGLEQVYDTYFLFGHVDIDVDVSRALRRVATSHWAACSSYAVELRCTVKVLT